MGCTGAPGHTGQTQERHHAKALGRWLTDECLPVCVLPEAWWKSWWAKAAKLQSNASAKRQSKKLKDVRGPPPESISACEWLNRYATDFQKWATPFGLSRSAVPEVVVKLALECRCSGMSI